MTTDAPARPEPVSQPESDRYWEGARNGELWLQRDKATGEYQFYPRAFSLATPGGEVEWVKASGNATLHTFGIVHIPPHPGFMGKRSEVPYITAIVELEEGPRMATNIVGVDPEPENLEHWDGAKGGLHEDQRRLYVAELHAVGRLMPLRAAIP